MWSRWWGKGTAAEQSGPTSGRSAAPEGTGVRLRQQAGEPGPGQAPGRAVEVQAKPSMMGAQMSRD